MFTKSDMSRRSLNRHLQTWHITWGCTGWKVCNLRSVKLDDCTGIVPSNVAYRFATARTGRVG